MIKRCLFLSAALAIPLALVTLARGDDRTSATALLDAAQHGPHAALVAEPITKGREALERATRLRSAGDEAHARLADGLALAWAETARDLLRAIDAEEHAGKARTDLSDAGARAERERALLEEGIARTGRLRAQIEEVERGRKEAPTRTSALGANVDGGRETTGRALSPGGRPRASVPDGGPP
jgi:hypothetical protein